MAVACIRLNYVRRMLIIGKYAMKNRTYEKSYSFFVLIARLNVNVWRLKGLKTNEGFVTGLSLCSIWF
jgi:hypothetical protein